MYKVNCENLNRYEVARLITELVNAPVAVDDYDIVFDDDNFDFDEYGKPFYDINYFEITEQYRSYDLYDLFKIERCLNKYEVKYELCN